ncbi:MAG: helix-turn-helix transcriptional regulator [Proteobacteria bacterium]|nr:helix-turn-helix transcriptional regulator [Pseudomonadota bacterium]
MRHKEKLAISVNIKMLIARKGLSILELSNKIGVTRFQIDNILYGRSYNKDVVSKIATFFNVTPEKLKEEVFEMHYTSFDIGLYNQITSLIEDIILHYNLKISKSQMDEVIRIIYKYKEDMPDTKSAIKAIILYMYGSGEIYSNQEDTAN